LLSPARVSVPRGAVGRLTTLSFLLLAQKKGAKKKATDFDAVHFFPDHSSAENRHLGTGLHQTLSFECNPRRCESFQLNTRCRAGAQKSILEELSVED
jgi:hypothetical protein